MPEATSAIPSQRIERDAAEIITLLPLLELAITPDPSRRAPSPAPSSRSSSGPSRPPWVPPVASAILSVARGTRDEEASLRVLAGLPPRPRGAAGRQTILSLRALAPLAAHPRVPDPRAQQSATLTARWLSAVRQALGQEETWRRIPRAPGEPEARCPYCGLPSLRMSPQRGLVRCVSPSCQDLDGARPRARLTSVRIQREWHWQLWWQDGTEGLAPRKEYDHQMQMQVQA